MLAYLFWHQPRPGVDRDDYEEAQRAFHAALESPSACFRLAALPFEDGEGYEDWYLVDGWQQLGDLNTAAVDTRRRGRHDLAASMVDVGWGGVYRHVAGPRAIPEEASWREKRPSRSPGEVLSPLAETTPVWRRQMVLGPAPEFCIGVGGPARRRVV